jgi:hypothetical protein
MIIIKTKKGESGIKKSEDKNINKASKKLYRPLKLFIVYILTTLLINLFGPWEYREFNKVLMITFILIFLMAITFTFIFSVNSKKDVRLSFGSNKKRLFKNEGVNLTKRCIELSLLLFSMMIGIKITEVGLPNTDNLFNAMAMAYTNKIEYTGQLNKSAWLFNYFSIVYVIAIVLGTYYFNKVNKFYKILFFIIVLETLIYHVLFVGSQKAIGDIIIYISSALFIKFSQSGKKIKIKNLVLMLSAVFGSVLLFSNILLSRMNLWRVEYYSIGGRAFLNTDHWMLHFFNNDLKLGVGTFLYYISHGYYGLSLSLDLPFTWSYGYGSSFALSELYDKVIPLTDEFVASYPIRMEAATSWSAYANWHTIFPWLASDLTFPGSIVFLCVVIAIYAKSWKWILKKGHWVNILMFCHVNIFLLYVPANNQLFQTRASLIVTVIILGLWIFNYSYQKDEERKN